MKLKNFYLPLIAFIVSVSALIAFPHQAKAVSAADWRAGRIIDDAVFFNKDSMSVQQIQNFLNAKVPSCDRWNPTRFTYAGKPYGPPYTCLKEYQENPTTKENNIGRFNPDGSPYNVPGGWSAAQIIKDASMAYGINPQVLIVMLQKETAIVTDTWAAGWQYDRAMGYGCPDSGPNGTANCSSSYYGFYNQVGNAAWQLKRYTTNPNEYNFKAGVTRNILWQVNGVCGSSPVYLENSATAALYNYTPYQPNQAALNNLYGTGDGCSAYGNRNFWRIFNDWFGTSSFFNSSIQLTGDYATSVGTQTVAGNRIYAQYSVKNTGSSPIFVGGLGICGRNNGNNVDFGFDNSVTIPAYGQITVSKSRVIENPGILKIFICSYNENLGGWSSDFYPYSFSNDPRGSTTEVLTNPTIVSPITFSPLNPTLGQQVTASFDIQNNSNQAVTIPAIGVAARDINGNNVGYPSELNLTIPPNSVYTYSKSRTFTSSPGNYKYWITSYRNNIWDDNYPVTFGGHPRSGYLYVFDNPTIVSPITFSPLNPTLGQQVTASFDIQNNSNQAVTIPAIGVAARDINGNNVGYPSELNLTIPPNSVYTYSKSRTFTSSPGNYKYWITSYRNNIWDDNYPVTFGGHPRSGYLYIKNQN
jgi:hypothetical protein